MTPLQPSAAATAVVARCAAHPARPAVDSCPTCGRPRCGADAQGVRCVLCGTARAGTRPPAPLELLVRAALAAFAAALVAAVVNSEYVGTDWFAYLAPAIAGIATGAAATAAAPGRAVLGKVRALGVFLGIAAVALGFVLEGTYEPVEGKVQVLVPYVIAGVAAWLWTAPPRRRRSATASPGA